MSIIISQLTKRYGEQKAVDNISFSINKGEIVGFLGPNGAGKSTTMKILTGFIQADEGQVNICGMDIRTHPLKTKMNIGYLPESNALYYDMYIREYLEFICGMYRIRNKQPVITNTMKKVGLLPEASKKIGQLSKGYKQRVGLAAALVHDPEVLILDEPTSGLDPNQIIEIREIIRHAGASKAVLFSSHIMQEVQAICDRIIILHKGSVMADDYLSTLQKGNSNALIVNFTENIDITWLQHLKNVQAIHKITEQQWKLSGSDLTAIRKDVMQLALDKNLNILSMQEYGENLEVLFRNLTMENK